MPYLYAIDFDKTITIKHTGGFEVFADAAAKERYLHEEIIKNIRNLARLKRIFTRIHLNGDLLAIASLAVKPSLLWVKLQTQYQGLTVTEENILGGRDLILAYLDVAFGKERSFLLPEYVVAYRSEEINNKNYHIGEIIKRYHKGKAPSDPAIEKVTLIDDDKNMLLQASLLGHRTIWVKPDSDDYLDQLERELDEREILCSKTSVDIRNEKLQPLL